MKPFDLKVGFRCNNDCVHCVVAHKRSAKDLTTHKIKEIIRKRPRQECIIFTGGEPTIREDFFELLKYTKKRGHRISLQTNGAQFAKISFAKEASKYIDGLIVAIHSFKKNIHDKIVRNPGMYKKTIEGFKNIVKFQIPHKTQTVISKFNSDHLKETLEFIQSISPGVKMHLTFPHPEGNAYCNWKKVVPQYSEIRGGLQKILKKYGNLLFTEAIPLCYLYPYQDVVDNWDEAMAKIEPYGGIDSSREGGVVTDYASLMLGDKRKGLRCKACVFNVRCAGVWKEYLEFYKDKLDLFPILQKSYSFNSLPHHA